MKIRCIGCISALLSVITTALASAQRPAGADTLSPRAVAESLRVLASLTATLKSHPNDAATLERQGLLAWSLAERAVATPPIKGLDAMAMRRVADNALQMAAQLAGDNAHYLLEEGEFLATSGSAGASYAYFDRAVELARKSGDPALHAEAALQSGRVRWRRYDAIAFRVLNDSIPVTKFAALEMARGNEESTLLNAMADAGKPVTESGNDDYLRAEDLFREAYAASPTDARAFHQLAMLLAERYRWTELKVIARDRIARLPGDEWGWLALGLALHRAGQTAAASAAFDTALVAAGPRERNRLFGLQRVMKPSDTVRFLRADSASRALQANQFWAQANPLWSRPGNDIRTEYLARVTYAELRWTVEERGVRGADSDRGDVYIRYGPPSVILLRSPKGGVVDVSTNTAPSNLGHKPGGGDDFNITAWGYSDHGFVFWGMPTYATARVPPDDEGSFADAIETRPFGFENVVTGRVLLMPVIAARFRAPGDSVDLYIATQAPMTAIRAASAANAPVHADFWMFGRSVPNGYRDSLAFDASGVHAWTYRVAPSNYMYRIEATAPEALAAGQVMRWIEAGPDTATGFTMRGFGVSDLLLATRADARHANPARWRDFDVAPLLGTVAKNAQIDIVWENYELGALGGSAHYQVALTVLRTRSGPGRVAAAIVGAVGAAVGVERRDDRVVSRFERTVPHAATLVDHVALQLGDTPPGQYRVVLQITDHVSGRTVTRNSEIVIRP